jgi:GAF domain-containing protein
VQYLDVEKEELLLLGWIGFHPDSAAHWQRISVGNESTCGAALKARQRVIVADVNDPASGLTQEGIADYKLSELVAVQSTPLVSRDGRLVGMMSTHWRRLHQPAEADLALFDVLARQAADVVDRVGT